MSETLPVTRPDGLEMRYLVVPLSDDLCAVSLVNDSDARIIVHGYRGPTLYVSWQIGPGETLHDPNAVRFDRLEAFWADARGRGPQLRRGLCRFEHERAGEDDYWTRRSDAAYAEMLRGQ